MAVSVGVICPLKVFFFPLNVSDSSFKCLKTLEEDSDSDNPHD